MNLLMNPQCTCSENEIKNYWNTNLKKRLKQKGLDPNAHKPINATGLKQKSHKPVSSSGSASLLNRVASKYAVDFNRDLLTGIINGNSTIFHECSQNSGEVNKMAGNTTSTYCGFSDNCSFSDDLTEFFSNEEISDMYTKVDDLGFMEELKGILSYGGEGAGVTKDSPEVNGTDEMDFLDSWNGKDNMDLEKLVSSLDSKVGVLV